MSEDLDWIDNEGVEPEYLLKEVGPIDVMFRDGRVTKLVTNTNRMGENGVYYANCWTMSGTIVDIVKWRPSKASQKAITATLDNTATVVLPEANNSSKDSLGSSVGVKHDQGKLEWTLLPWKALKPIVEVLMYGNKKYPDPTNANWKKVEPKRYKDALLRHVTAWLDGEKVDEETGKSHLAHAGCCLLFLLWFEVTGKIDE